MKVKLLRDHLSHKKGDVVEADTARADYWEKVGVAEKVKGAAYKASKETTAEVRKEKNDKAGPPQKKAPVKEAPKKTAPKKERKLVEPIKKGKK